METNNSLKSTQEIQGIILELIKNQKPQNTNHLIDYLLQATLLKDQKSSTLC
jgi:hypothetical protein